MKDAVESLIEKFDLEFTPEQRDFLRFLYENLHLEELSDKEQCFFIDYFYKSETLRNMAAFALELADIMREICELVPAIEKAERLTNGQERRLYNERKWQIARASKVKSSNNKKRKYPICSF